MNFVGKAKKIDDIDLPRIGRKIGVGEDELHAFLDVETRGGGFDSKNRPKMLFEPHVFYRELGAGKRRDAAVKAGLAYRKWGMKKYPRDSYPRLLEAMKIDKKAAMKSASWGLGQVMGYHAEALGYDGVEDMVTRFMADEEEHLRASVEFIKVNDLDDDLRAIGAAKTWDERVAAARGFARGYNGRGYEKNEYHTKLAAAYVKWSKIRDTEIPVTFKKIKESKDAPIDDEEPIDVVVKPVAAPAPDMTQIEEEAVVEPFWARLAAIIAGFFLNRNKGG